MSAEVIDSHVHVMLPVEKQVELLKEAGVDRAVLFSTVVHPEKAESRAEFRNEMETLNKILRGEINPVEARIASIKELVSVMSRKGNMFMGFGTVPAGQDISFTSQGIEKHIAGNKLSGIGEITFGAGMAHSIENIFRAVSDYGNSYPLWIHTFNPATLDDIKTLTGFADKYPGVKVILGHGGGSYWLETVELVSDRKNIYYDISAMFSILPVKFALKEFPERVLFSSDMPYGSPYVARDTVEYIVEDKAVREMVLGGNISNLLNRKT